MKNSFVKGMSIVEIVIASGIIAISITGIIGAIQIYLKIVHQNAREAQAIIYMDETVDAIQSLRDDGYTKHIAPLDFDTEYSLFWNGASYEFGTSTITLPHDITRTIVFFEVYRGLSDEIVSSGGSVDPDTKKAKVTITWEYQEKIKQVSSEMLIHNMYDN